VRLECRHFSDGKIEHQVDGVTDKNGTYTIELKDNHDEEICEVVLVQSPLSTCAEIPKGRDRARVLLADAGLSSNIRYANSLGFLKDTPLPICVDVLKQYNQVT
jgi:Pollen protein Ole e 1 like